MSKKLYSVGRLRFEHKAQAVDHALLLSVIGKRPWVKVRYDGFAIETAHRGKLHGRQDW